LQQSTKIQSLRIDERDVCFRDYQKLLDLRIRLVI